MTVLTVTSANVGTKLATTTDAHITGLTMTAPTSMNDARTPLLLVDSATAPTGLTPVLFNADLTTLGAFSFGYKQVGPLPVSGTSPTWPISFGAFATRFASGVFVVSCPTGASFSLTTGP